MVRCRVTKGGFVGGVGGVDSNLDSAFLVLLEAFELGDDGTGRPS